MIRQHLKRLTRNHIGLTLLQRASWVAGAEMVNRITRIVTAVALARSLGIAEFGIAMAALTIHELVRAFIQNGLGTRIVTVSDAELPSTTQAVHRFNWLLGITLFTLQLLVAWPVAIHFASDDLAWAIVALAFVHLIYPLAMVRVYLAQRQDRWALIGSAIAAQAAIDNILTAALALLGFGIWSVVVPKLLVAGGWVLFHRSRTAWPAAEGLIKPRYRELLRYATRVLGVELLTALRMHGDKVVVGILLGPVALGLYSFATNVGRGITLSLSQGLSHVILPHLSRSRRAGQLRQSYAETLVVMMMTTAPLVLLQVTLADWLVPLVFGEKWMAASGLVAIVALASMSHPMITATSQMLRADNRVNEDLGLSIIFSLFYALGLLLAVPYGVTAAAMAIAAIQLCAAAGITLYGLHSSPHNFKTTNQEGLT